MTGVSKEFDEAAGIFVCGGDKGEKIRELTPGDTMFDCSALWAVTSHTRPSRACLLCVEAAVVLYRVSYPARCGVRFRYRSSLHQSLGPISQSEWYRCVLLHVALRSERPRAKIVLPAVVVSSTRHGKPACTLRGDSRSRNS